MAEKPYQIIVGLEVHVQLLTQTKLFCGCKTTFGMPPNSQVCPVCLGMPGTLPVMNRKAFELAMRAALALNCQIASFTKWDRKNYYYPDLPKNYQISQYDLPFSHDGWLEINAAADPKKEYVPKRIGIIRAHLEEDAGKSIHDESGRGGDTKVDLNRTGTPLVEIVSQPDIRSPEEAKAYLEELRLMLRELGVSDCEMQEGSLRCDANVNIHIHQADGTHHATPLVEVKNLNSFGSVARAIAYEAERQYAEYQKDPINFRFGRILKTTAGWNDAKGETIVQRHKESAADYRYFPEPDLVPVTVEQQQVAEAITAMGELPSAQRTRLQQDPYSLSAYDAQVLTSWGRKLVAYYEDVANISNDPKATCNWICNEVVATLKEKELAIDQFPIEAPRLAGLVSEVKASGLKREKARDVYQRMLSTTTEAPEIMKELGYVVIADPEQLRPLIRAAIDANPKAAEDFKAGKEKAADRIKGLVMKETKGMANAEVLSQILLEELAK
ncbi:MAG: Asp-tRNA(Asn)/Glu-tRNA(Gln) amidotransferase subunit GatB [Zavarzinella sp.]